MTIARTVAEVVVANQAEFNSYGAPMPAGTADLVDMAEQAISDVQTNGTVTTATFYSTPASRSEGISHA